MTITLVLITIFNLFSIMFTWLALGRLFKHLEHYKIEEGKHSMLFGFMKIEHVVAIYIIMQIAFIVGSYFFVYYLMIR